MRALWVMWPSNATFEHVAHARRAAAIDSVLIAAPEVPPAPSSRYYPTYASVIESVRRCKAMGVATYLVITWCRQWAPIPQIPLAEYALRRCYEAARAVNETGADGIAWDFEDYNLQQNGVPQPPVPFMLPAQAHAGLNVIGALPDHADKTAGWWFTEDSYNKNRWYKIKRRGWKMGRPICPGAWAEQWPDLRTYLKNLERCYRGNWWLYSHTRLREKMPNPQPQQYKTMEPLPFSFWETL